MQSLATMQTTAVVDIVELGFCTGYPYILFPTKALAQYALMSKYLDEEADAERLGWQLHDTNQWSLMVMVDGEWIKTESGVYLDEEDGWTYTRIPFEKVNEYRAQRESE